jgi:hypothetical protein
MTGFVLDTEPFPAQRTALRRQRIDQPSRPPRRLSSRRS